ncbi:PaaX family transcriptional regulator [Nisaea nitritireducens]|uniref:PaaX family transcriptional regulator n=1 Tax=Nisaea nitritireducens TaxID=568392 RepID=UPI0018686F62|nr:PaaX family transcriptional regulator C-terminal domain-containing protein [Nisaea nitritireducens]
MSIAVNPDTLSVLARDTLTELKPRAKSLIVTVYGDAILPHGGTAWLSDLIRLMEVFDVGERVVRTAVFRLAQDDILTARHIGRRSIYSLTENGRQEFDAAQRRIYAPPRTRKAADAAWQIALLTSAVDSAERDALRKALGWAGYGSLGPQVLLGIGGDLDGAKQELANLGLEDRVALFEAAPGSPIETLRTLCRETWDLEETDNAYRAFIDSFDPVLNALEENHRLLTPETAFELRILMVHVYRRALLRDPGLPADIMPETWSGRRATDLAARMYDILKEPAQSYLEKTVNGVDGSLPPPSDAYFSRFQGMVA